MPRFFISASNIFGGVAYLDSKAAEHLKVLRIRRGEVFTVCDGAGNDYICRMKDTGAAEAEILETVPSVGEPSVACTLYIAYPKGDKAETVIQKAVELGADSIVLFPSVRCVSRPDAASIAKKLIRWQKIAEEAAKQCSRGRIPDVSAAASYEAMLERASRADLPFFLYEDEKKLHLKQVLDTNPAAGTISIVTGPEGGFEPAEAEAASNAGMHCVSIGPRILRCETAPICALSAVMYATGNL